MRTTWMAVAWLGVGFLPGTGAAQEPVEVPLRVDGGRVIVEVTDERGRAFDFVLGVSNGFVTRSGAQRLEGATLALGSVPFSLEGHQTVPDDYLAHEGSAEPLGIIGGEAFLNYDILIDAPHGRMFVKPAGRSVRWPGQSLTNPVPVEAFHDYLLRISVQVGTSVYPALIDLAGPKVQLSPPIQEELGVQDGPLDSFRMGYSGWPSVPVEVILTPTMRGWGGETSGFVLLGAPVVLDCALAISWRHKEVRTCIR